MRFIALLVTLSLTFSPASTAPLSSAITGTQDKGVSLYYINCPPLLWFLCGD